METTPVVGPWRMVSAGTLVMGGPLKPFSPLTTSGVEVLDAPQCTGGPAIVNGAHPPPPPLLPSHVWGVSITTLSHRPGVVFWLTLNRHSSLDLPPPGPDPPPPHTHTHGRYVTGFINVNYQIVRKTSATWQPDPMSTEGQRSLCLTHFTPWRLLPEGKHFHVLISWVIYRLY